MNISDDKIFEKTMMEIGYVAAFYNMRPQAQAIFDFYQTARGNDASHLAALLGQVLLFIGASNYNDAVEILEKFIEDCKEKEKEVPAEAKVFLALVYKKSKKRADRMKTLLEDVRGSSENAAIAAAQELGAI